MASEPRDFHARYWTERALQYGGDPAATGQTARSQAKRFTKLLEVGPLAGASLLDVGCGNGGLFASLKAKQIAPRYTGFDVAPGMIEVAHSIHPEAHDRFRLCDILTEDVAEQFDYVIANGPLNVPLPGADNIAVLIRMMRRMYELCTVGFAITMTSAFTRKPDPGTFYYDPGQVLTEVVRFCPATRLDHTYLPHDFAIFGYKRDLYDA